MWGFWVILLGGLILVGTAEARLGETKEEIIKRYGKPFKIEKHENEPVNYEKVCIQSGDFMFAFYLYDGAVEYFLILKSSEKGELFTRNEVESFLLKNSKEEGFVLIDEKSDEKQYLERSSGRGAMVEPAASGDIKMSIWTEKGLNLQLRAAKNRNSKESTQSTDKF